jgi:hypothetical protein
MKIFSICALLLLVYAYLPAQEINPIMPEYDEITIDDDTVSKIETYHYYRNFPQSNDAYTINEAMDWIPGAAAVINNMNRGYFNYRGFSSEYNSVVIEGVPLDGLADRKVDLTQIPAKFFNVIKINNCAEIINGGGRLGTTMNLSNPRPEKFATELSLYGGNYYGDIFLRNRGKKNLFYWDIAGNYLTSGGFTTNDESGNELHFDDGLRRNSAFANLGVYSKAGFSDGKSDVSISYIFIDNDKNIPVSLYADEPEFLKEIQWKLNIFNLGFDTRLDKSLHFFGNVYYKQFKNILDKYDDETYTTRFGLDAYRRISDDAAIGANLGISIENGLFEPTTLYFNWQKEQFREQKNSGFNINTYESELVKAGVEQDIHAGNYTSFKILAGFSYYKPLFRPDNPEFLPEGNGSPVLSLNFKRILSEKWLFTGEVSYLSQNPSMEQIFPEINYEKINYNELFHSNALKGDIGIRYFDEEGFSGGVNFFAAHLNHLRLVIPDTVVSFTDGDGLVLGSEMYLNISTGFADLRLMFRAYDADIKGYEQQTGFGYYIPRVSLTASVEKKYDIGIGWRTEFLYASEPQYYDNPVDSRFIVNIRLSALIFGRLEALVRVDNIFDEFYSDWYGYPRPGLVFAAGANLKL